MDQTAKPQSPAASTARGSSVPHDPTGDDYDDELSYPLRVLTSKSQQNQRHRGASAVRAPTAVSRIGSAVQTLLQQHSITTPAPPPPPQQQHRPPASRPVSARVVSSTSARPTSAAVSRARSSTQQQQAAPVSFEGFQVRPPSPTHSPTRPGSLAFKPFLSHSTACLVEHNAKYDFRAAIHIPLNSDLVVDAHKNLSLREPTPSAPQQALDAHLSDLTPREQRAALRELEARNRRRNLESRLAVNLSTRDVLNTPRSVMESAVEMVLPSGNHCTAEGIDAERAKARLRAYVLENHFRVSWRMPRNDDLRLTYTNHESLKQHEQPYVPQDKVFQYRVPDEQLAAAMMDADAFADAARPAHASRPATPRSVARFFAAGEDGDAAFLAQDVEYAAQMRSAVRAAVSKAESRLKKHSGPNTPRAATASAASTQLPPPPTPPQHSQPRPTPPVRPVSARSLPPRQQSNPFQASRPATARQRAPPPAEEGVDAELERRGVSVHAWLRGLQSSR